MKKISNQFVVNTVEDGMSQQQIFTRNANAALPPRSQSDNPTLPSGWTYTPQGVDNTHPDEYVSMRSKDSSGVWSDYSSKVPYSHYGEDGTSISIRGVAIEIAQGTLPDALEPYEQDLSLTSLGDIILFDETEDSTFGPAIIKRVQPFIEDEETKHFVVESVTDGDGYLIASKSGQAADEGHLYVAKEFDDSGGDYYFWQDCGRIKGEKGDDAVMYVLEPSIPQFNTDKERTKAQVCTVRAYKIEGKTKSAFTGCFEIAPDSMLGRISYSWGNYVSLGTNYDRNATAYKVSLWDKDPQHLAVDEPDPVLLVSITIPIAFDGVQGERGKIGRFFYFGGTFDSSDSDPTHTFVVNDAQAPYFEHTENGQKRYHVFNYDTNGSYTMTQMWAISSNWNNEPWEAMTNDFKYIITEALFGSYAHLGSWIFNGDYMISEKDKNGNSRGQQEYNGMPSNEKVTTGFIPSIAFDAANGRASFCGDWARFNPDGSGWLSNKKLSWNSYGELTLASAKLSGNLTLEGDNSQIRVGKTDKAYIVLTNNNYGDGSIQLRDADGVVAIQLTYDNDSGGGPSFWLRDDPVYAVIDKLAIRHNEEVYIDSEQVIFDTRINSRGLYVNKDNYTTPRKSVNAGIGIDNNNKINFFAKGGNWTESAWPEYSYQFSPDTLSKGSVQVMSLGSLKAIFDGTYYSDRLSKLSVLIIRNNAY